MAETEVQICHGVTPDRVAASRNDRGIDRAMVQVVFAADVRRWSLRRIVPFLSATFFFILMATLYLTDRRTLYDGIIRAWGVWPWAFPFLDSDTVLSAVRCLQRGVDVYVVNPCDVLGRIYDYSPLWLVLARIPNAGAWLQPIGLSVDIAFLSSILLCPVGRGWRDTTLIAFGTISTAPLFAVERANNDLVIFVLAVAAATFLQQRRGWRLLGYGAALLAGLLKYYPMMLMLAASRERPLRFLAVAGGALAVVFLFLIIDGHDLVRALRLIPTGPYFSEMFGSIQLPGGLVQVFGDSAMLRTWLHVGMIAVALTAGVRWGATPLLREDLDRLSPQERGFLMIGSLLLPSLFFTAQNIGYRAVHLLLVLPPMLALGQAGQYRRAHRYTAGFVFALLWAEGWRHLLAVVAAPLGTATFNTVFLVAWIVREAMWWWTITALVALATSLQLHSEMGREMTRWVRQGLMVIKRPRLTNPSEHAR